jgi:hypothetical protein
VVYAPRKSSSGVRKGEIVWWGRQLGGCPRGPQEHATLNWAESGKSSRGSPRGMASAPTAGTAATFPLSTPPPRLQLLLLSFAFLRDYDLLDFDQFFLSSDSSRLLIPCFILSLLSPTPLLARVWPLRRQPYHLILAFSRRARHFAQHERYGQQPCFAAYSGSWHGVTSELTMT